MASVGEIHLVGEPLATGYCERKSPDLDPFGTIDLGRGSKEACYRTGDLGRWNETVSSNTWAAATDKSKIHGIRVETAEIEAAIRKIVDETDVIVVARRGTERTVLSLISSRRPLAKSISECRNESLRQQLPPYMIPEHFVAVAEWPLNHSGKIDHSKLPSPDSKPSSDVSDSVPASTEMEKLIMGVWEEVLERRGLGHSRQFLRCRRRLASKHESRLALGATRLEASRSPQEMEPKIIFEYSTIAELAAGWKCHSTASTKFPLPTWPTSDEKNIPPDEDQV